MFPQTSWTVIASATLHGDHAGRRALEELCAGYYEPVRRFIRWQGKVNPEEVDDLTQSFFLYVCEKGIAGKADRLQGKFRSFLCLVLKRFLAKARRSDSTLKRGGEVIWTDLDDELASAEMADFSPEAQVRFDREWALALMDAALRRVADEIRQSRGEVALATLGGFLGGGTETVTYEVAAGRLASTVPAVKMEVTRWRRRLGELVRKEIGQTVHAPHEVEEEMAYLRSVLQAR
jgi:hypothetical protein